MLGLRALVRAAGRNGAAARREFQSSTVAALAKRECCCMLLLPDVRLHKCLSLRPSWIPR